ncbi:hypothetical protein AC1031_010968 [Aphanomyces cochlioides]|nr:hypothetical protein AC1031_010968 [Aphanomyces cochlioides]
MDPVEVSLMPSESLIIHSPSISTLTFYTTRELHVTESSIIRAQASLQRRLDAIVQANPWLTGQIRSPPDNGKSLLLHCNPNASSILLETITMPSLSPSMEYEDVAAMLSNLEVPKGSDIVNAGHRLFRVNWITISSTLCAIFVSLSHGLGDGHTYYRLYGMLSEDAPVVVLKPQRLNDFPRVRTAAVKDINNVLAMLGRVLPRDLTQLDHHPRTLHSINTDWIAQEKAKAAQTVPFVSTNDIITSWFFRQTKADIGIMIANLRGRAEGIEPDMAGNYHTVVVYQPDDFATPSLIRESIANAMCRARSTDLPTETKTISLVTSWATLYEPVAIPEWSLVEHWPIMNGRSVFPNGAVVFQRTKDTIGVLMRTQQDFVTDPTPFMP